MDQSKGVTPGEEDFEIISRNALLFGGQWPIMCYWLPAQ